MYTKHTATATRGGVLSKVRFGLGEENWSLKILGGCSAKGRIWTWEENWNFGNLGGGRCSCQRSDLDLGKKIGVLEISEGVFCQRSDLDSGKKMRVLVIWGGGRGVLANLVKNFWKPSLPLHHR